MSVCVCACVPLNREWIRVKKNNLLVKYKLEYKNLWGQKRAAHTIYHNNNCDMWTNFISIDFDCLINVLCALVPGWVTATVWFNTAKLNNFKNILHLNYNVICIQFCTMAKSLIKLNLIWKYIIEEVINQYNF